MVVGGDDMTSTSKRDILGKLTGDEMMLHGTNYNQRHNHENTMLHLRFKITYMLQEGIIKKVIIVTGVDVGKKYVKSNILS